MEKYGRLGGDGSEYVVLTHLLQLPPPPPLVVAAVSAVRCGLDPTEPEV